MPRRSGKRVKTRTHVKDAPKGATVITAQGSSETLQKEEVPRSIVAKGSKVIPQVGELVRDIRKLMGPYTATNLREKSYNRMKDYSEVSAQLGVTHLLTMTQTTRNIVLRIGRTPMGPTLHFRVTKYSLARQVRASQKRPFESPAAFMSPPLVVLNNFGQAEDQHVKLMRVTFQKMFPTINVKSMKLSECRRVVLFHYRKEDGLVEMRHYAIRVGAVDINRNIKKRLHSHVPNLGDLQDISQFLNDQSRNDKYASDSDGDEMLVSRVDLPERFVGGKNAALQQSSMKLTELGPRLRLEIFKVERGIGEGDVLYHKFEEKSIAEAAATKARIESMKALKEERKAVQSANVKRKRTLEEEKRIAKADAKRARLGLGDSTKGDSAGIDGDDDVDDDESDSEDGAAEDGEDEGEYGDDDEGQENESDDEARSMNEGN